MKTKITFKLETDTYISVMRNGKKIGHIYSQLKSKDYNKPYPHTENEYCLNAIQICGFDKISEVWACGPFHGKKDVVIHFTPDIEYIEKKKKLYKSYVENKLNKGEADTIQNFTDWNSHNI
jgi:hypothetical protein